MLSWRGGARITDSVCKPGESSARSSHRTAAGTRGANGPWLGTREDCTAGAHRNGAALAGRLAGIFIADRAVAGLNAWKPFVLQSYPPISLDVRTLAFTFTLTVLTGLVFGIGAGLLAASGIRHSRRTEVGKSYAERRADRDRVRQVLVVAELGLSLVLLIGAGLLAKVLLPWRARILAFPPRTCLRCA